MNGLLGHADAPRPYAFYLADAADAEPAARAARRCRPCFLGSRVRAAPADMRGAGLSACGGPRCSATMPGHAGAVLHVSYSADGGGLARGGGAALVGFGDVASAPPRHVCKGHQHHVLCTAWAPDGARFASADKRGEIRVWDPATGGALGAPLRRHAQWVTALSWEPMHRHGGCERLAARRRTRPSRCGTCAPAAARGLGPHGLGRGRALGRRGPALLVLARPHRQGVGRRPARRPTPRARRRRPPPATPTTTAAAAPPPPPRPVPPRPAAARAASARAHARGPRA